VAHSKSALKRHRQSLKRREANRARTTEARTAVRRARELIAEGKSDEAQAAVREASAVLDRAAQKGVLHRNNAARRKSRLAKMLKHGAPEKKTPARKSRARAAKT
jgi:small subunit ribosomal protein S20